MIVAIDSAKQMTYTGIISGSDSNIYNFYDEMEKIFLSKNIHAPFHWSSLTTKNRKVFKRKIEDLVNKSDGVKFNIFCHKIPNNLLKKKIILEILPYTISLHLSHWLKSLSGYVSFEFDDDYNFKCHTTQHFMDKIIKYIIPNLTKKSIKIRYHKGIIKATIKQKVGNINLICKISDIKNSKSIQIIDIILGYVCDGDYSFDREKFHFKKIC